MDKIDPSLFTVKRLTSKTDISSFCSSDTDLNDYLKEEAIKDQKHLYSVTKVVEYEGTIVGYFSLITDNINIDNVDDEIVRKYSYRKLPAIKLARLATDKGFVGRGVGSYMMDCIFFIVLNLIEDIGCRVITVDAKQGAQTFYENFAFKVVESDKKRDFIPMYMDIGALIEEADE